MTTRYDPAEIAYELTAEHYDRFTAHHDYARWTQNLLTELDRLGLAGDRLLDVACGTGKSFLPMLARGWRVSGVDISGAMLEVAHEKVGDRVELHCCDMRRLPELGEFDLVWCLGDAINYLLGTEAVESALRSMASSLATGGLLLFDVNTLATYRGFFASSELIDLGDHQMLWNGHAGDDAPAGAEVVATLDVRTAGGRLVTRARHRQRHHPPADVERALGRAGLLRLGTYGHGYDAVLEHPLDEAVHTKAIYIARRGKRR